MPGLLWIIVVFVDDICLLFAILSSAPTSHPCFCLSFNLSGEWLTWVALGRRRKPDTGTAVTGYFASLDGIKRIAV